MGRKRAFDTDAVLAAAANAFRRHGYKDISVAELEKATGLVSGSIYNAFGDKAGLFKAALRHYVHGFVGQRIAAHAGEDATLEDLEGLFLSVFEPPLADGYGCLVTNSIVEFGKSDGIASADISDALAMLRRAIDGVLSRELGCRAGDTATLRLLALYHGVLALSRSPIALDAMAEMVRAEFRRLKDLREAAGSPHPPSRQPGDLSCLP
ncbi:TetR/AcrR family transcriptional regulator [Chelativorans sp.]|uniref:TetR/AcrR family transcriptional regulator n=1 Tax=Chelativorans sp. TaxID=2203393 RepID=UPI0028123D30|nr:TetR/AcrR family transcriptional regulator [Chelativorans sp.]